MKRLSGKKILISGSTLGIGKTIAKNLLQEGGRVVIFSRDPDHVKKALHELEPAGEVYGMPADVTNPDDIEAVFGFSDVKLGGLDILINNAGLAADGVQKTDMQQTDYIIKTNLTGYLNCAKLAIEKFKKEGHIINIGSLSAQTRDANGDIYVSAKSGINGFNDSLRRGLAEKNIKVTLIEPGAVATDLHGLPYDTLKQLEKDGQMLNPLEIANAVIYCLTRSPNVDIIKIEIKARKQNI